ncbi:MAG TPA: hypothetical protein VFA98_11240 [Thermoanaerobaculia bacterium]|nr:hypothetical protein [Thermoanaerobaculia bacterium]
MSIDVNPNPQAKFGSKFEVSFSGASGRTIKASGSPSGESVRVEIHEPATGYGSAEKPEQFAEVVMTTEEFVEWTARVLTAMGGSIQ